MKYTVSFTAWYLNLERIIQILGSGHISRKSKNLMASSGLERLTIKDELESWLRENKIPTLGELLVSNEQLRQGGLFTIYHDFYGRGLSKYKNPSKPLPRDAIAEIYNTLRYDQTRRLRILYNPNNLTCASAWGRLSGRTRLFCFCYLESISSSEIIARPYLIGDPHGLLELRTPTSWDASNYGEIHFSQIDQFSNVRAIYKTEKSAPQMGLLKTIPESSIKEAIGEIINEGRKTTDWGGEQSDLFSSNISIDGKHMSVAFLLKGPARFSEMKMTHLGKNGDQLVRLFSEPAQLLVLQHCHTVSSAVRSTMRAFAARVHDLRYFSIIDGYDSLRLLQAYKKCGM